nr:glycosyltransferase family 2 protein [Candidatus Baldrarchaeota archaeon]
MKHSVISVVIPAYNEEKTIGEVLSKTISVMESVGRPYEIIVVDDGSTDRTLEIASTYKVTVLSNGRNKGKGYALRKGFQHAKGDVIVTIDSDGAHDPKDIPEMLKPIFNGADVVSGSRFLGASKDFTSSLNRLGNFLINFIIMVLTRKRITDSQTGFRAIKKEILEKLCLESIGYEIETELTIKTLKNGFIIQEKPIACKKRRYHNSKLRVLYDGIKILKTILKFNFNSKIKHVRA